MRMWLDAACITVPTGDRSDSLAFSDASLGEGRHLSAASSRFMRSLCQ